jgi:Uma2 family endonuclease
MGPVADLDEPWQPPSVIRIVVEVLSPSTRARDLGHKRDVYRAAGLTCAIVDPVAEAIVEIAGPDAWIVDTPF